MISITYQELPHDILKTPPSPYCNESSKSAKKKRNRKAKLLKRHKGRCYYCGCNTVEVKIPDFSNNYPANLATVDHVYFKWDIRRSLCAETVLCCYHCNKTKNIYDNLHLLYGYDYRVVAVFNSEPTDAVSDTSKAKSGN